MVDAGTIWYIGIILLIVAFIATISENLLLAFIVAIIAVFLITAGSAMDVLGKSTDMPEDTELMANTDFVTISFNDQTYLVGLATPLDLINKIKPIYYSIEINDSGDPKEFKKGDKIKYSKGLKKKN